MGCEQNVTLNYPLSDSACSRVLASPGPFHCHLQAVGEHFVCRIKRRSMTAVNNVGSVQAVSQQVCSFADVWVPLLSLGFSLTLELILFFNLS